MKKHSFQRYLKWQCTFQNSAFQSLYASHTHYQKYPACSAHFYTSKPHSLCPFASLLIAITLCVISQVTFIFDMVWEKLGNVVVCPSQFFPFQPSCKKIACLPTSHSLPTSVPPLPFLHPPVLPYANWEVQSLFIRSMTRE
ncbi:hypothetical protein DID88_007397 [Monilinia fructigena]|uniref:Uncharacterized protein n=1 Tax=Monilinia fructigena TaxID=38457 RepID=A0A395JD71_9HELO|nr:hypothetical protein DID88_007397 [Monilinia fructigena]